MIAFPDFRPMLRHDGSYVTAFESEWLRSSLESAAHKAGYPKWWLAEHVTESVEEYLMRHIDEPVVSLRKLHHAVRSVLQVIGYPEVADHFAPSPPPVDVYLSDIARTAGAGYELAFFDLLESKLAELHQSRITHARCLGLQESVKLLSGAKVWSPGCRKLRDEIVDFVRHRVQTRNRMLSVTLS